MKVLFLTNGDVGAPLFRRLQERVDVTTFSEPLTVEAMAELKPDLAVSYSYRHIIKPEVLAMGRFINLHISMLPWNRGADPNAWSILDDTPKGVTIHVIDAGLDTGPALFQRAVHFDDNETLGGSYAKLQAAIQALFIENWPAIRDNTATPRPYREKGSYHHSREFAAIKGRVMGAEGWAVPICLLRARHMEASELAK
jgi:methionyl-tRNA formyltransferase